MLKPENNIVVFDHTLRQLNQLVEIRSERGDLRQGKVELVSGLIAEALRKELKEAK